MSGSVELVVELQDHGRVLVILLNRPHASNALDRSMLGSLISAFQTARDVRFRAVVLSGNGRNFCAGADLKAPALDLRTHFHPMLLALAALDKPVVAAVNGAAAGGGLGLALAADLRVLGTNAKLVPSWLPLGLVPDLGASWYLSRLLGPARALDWLASGDAITGPRALELGLANKVVADGEELATALTMAFKLADCVGPAVALTRRLLLQASQNGLAAQLESEAQAQSIAMAAPEMVAALNARVSAMGRNT